MAKYSNEFKLEALLKYAELTRSTFYYQLNRFQINIKK